jgi:hypothetical protein
LFMMLVKRLRWRLAVLLLLTALHVGAASFALRDDCQSRRTCLLGRDPTNRCTRAAGACFSRRLSVHRCCYRAAA